MEPIPQRQAPIAADAPHIIPKYEYEIKYVQYNVYWAKIPLDDFLTDKIRKVWKYIEAAC